VRVLTTNPFRKKQEKEEKQKSLNNIYDRLQNINSLLKEKDTAYNDKFDSFTVILNQLSELIDSTKDELRDLSDKVYNMSKVVNKSSEKAKPKKEDNKKPVDKKPAEVTKKADSNKKEKEPTVAFSMSDPNGLKDLEHDLRFLIGELKLSKASTLNFERKLKTLFNIDKEAADLYKSKVHAIMKDAEDTVLNSKQLGIFQQRVADMITEFNNNHNSEIRAYNRSHRR
jgi:hypothetical protein